MFAIAKADKRQRLFAIHLQQRQIRAVIMPYGMGGQDRIVLQGNGYAVGLTDHMVVGHNVTRRVNNKARPQRLHPPWWGVRVCLTVHEVMKKLLER